jgi:hypothetical protein
MKRFPGSIVRYGLAVAALLAAMLPVAAQEQPRTDTTSPLLPLARPIPGADPMLGVPVGVLTVLQLADLPPGMRRMMADQLEADRRGFEAVPEANIADELATFLDFLKAPEALSNGGFQSIARPGHSELGRWTLLGWMPGLREERGTRLISITRVFQRPDKVVAMLEEFHYRETRGGAVVMIEELINARVGPHPARLVISKTPSGLSRSKLIWVTPEAKFDFWVYDDVDHPLDPAWDRAWLIRLAESLGT